MYEKKNHKRTLYIGRVYRDADLYGVYCIGGWQ